MIEVFVDEKPKALLDICFIYQSDPYPGGHTYRLQIPQNAIDPEVAEYAKFCTASNPQERDARNWLFWLSHIVASISRPNEHPGWGDYVLNNISRIVVESSAITVEGACSDALHH